MALEKECDIVLRYLYAQGSKTDYFAFIYDLVRTSSPRLHDNSMIAIVSILHANNHITILDPVHITPVDRDNRVVKGKIMITTAGITFISATSYQKEKENSEYLKVITETNLEVNKNVLLANRWIAFATVVAALYYIVFLVDYFSKLIYQHLPLYYSTGVTALLLSIGFAAGVGATILASSIRKRRRPSG